MNIGRLLESIISIEHGELSRYRVYPQDITATITLAAAVNGGGGNVFGAWTQIVPITTIGFAYEVAGLIIEAANAATSYFVQLGHSTADGSDPTTAQILGERRLILGTPISRATEILEVQSQYCPANAKLWGRIKSASGAADQLEVSAVITRHIGSTNPIATLATWPWAT